MTVDRATGGDLPALEQIVENLYSKSAHYQIRYVKIQSDNTV